MTSDMTSRATQMFTDNMRRLAESERGFSVKSGLADCADIIDALRKERDESRSLLKEAGEALETFDALGPKQTLSLKAPDYVNFMQRWTDAFKTARSVLSKIKGAA